MTNITARILSAAFTASSVILWVSDRIHQLPLPPEIAQYWPLILAIALLIEAFQRGKVEGKDIQRTIDTWVKTFPVNGTDEKNTAKKKNDAFL